MGSVTLSTGTLVIRADASARIGAGHMMRCLALAQAWQLEGGQVVFLSHCESDALRQRITDGGMEFVAVAYPYPDPRDLQTTLDILRTRSAGARENLKPETGNPMWFVLDGYHFDPVYQQAVRTAGCRLLVIDDMAHLPAYHADILLNQNLGAEKLKYNCDSDTTLLLGSRYALLRQEFLAWRGWQRDNTDVAQKVLVTMGGGDPDNVTLKVIHALERVGVDGLEAVVVVGGRNPHFQRLESAVHDLKVPVRLVQNVANMPELMAWADVAVTAGGSTCWELAFMGLPSVVLILAENQRSIAEILDADGFAINLGWYTLLESSDIAHQLRSIIISSEIRGNLSNCARQLVDGGGPMRVIRQLHDDELALRPVQSKDCRLLWEWANDPVARAQSFSTEKILWGKHVVWFESKRTDVSIHFYIAVDKNDVPAGQIRYQIDGQEALVSVSLAPEQRGRGYGAEIIRLGTRKLWATTKTNIIHAYIKQDNTASVRAFAKAGFISAGMTEVHGCPALHYVLRKAYNHENSFSN
jgi:UDP-2,4-diacetamido-2,4,6-trideoxy-beta-L-altropyranose hydrolase